MVTSSPRSDAAEVLAALVRALSGDAVGDPSIVERARGLIDDSQALRLLLESTSEIISRHAIDGSILYVSPSVRSVLGYDPEALIGSSGAALIDPADVERVIRREPDAFAGPGELTRFRARHADGRWLWFESTIRIVTDASGEPVQSVAISRNVDDRVRAEGEARRQAEQTIAIYERISDAFFALDRDWRVIYMNPIAERMRTTGKREEIYGRNMWDVFPDLIETKFYTEYHRAVAEGVPVSLEEYYPRLDRWFEATAYPSEEGLAVFFRDVTDRKRSEQAIRESEHRFRAAFDDAAIPSALRDFAGVIQRVNPAMCALLGRDEHELVGTTFGSFTHPDDLDRATSVMTELAASHRSNITYDKRLIRADGEVIWTQVSSALVRNAAGEPMRVISQVLDTTERRVIEDALRANERRYAEAYERERAAAERLRGVDEMKNMFLSAVSHELRTPLTAIIGFAETLSARNMTLSPEQRTDMLTRLRRSSRKLERMLGDLLDLDRLSRGIMEPRRRPTDMPALIEGVLSESEPAGARPLTVGVEPIIAEVDAAHIERIIENLVSNAVRHTPPGTEIWLTVRKADGGIEIVVEDAGPGVPADLRSTLFEPFRRGPDVPAHSPGVGIGLSLVERFTALHGGRAWITDRQGGGASFHVVIPAKVRAGSGRKGIRSGRLRAERAPASKSTG